MKTKTVDASKKAISTNKESTDESSEKTIEDSLDNYHNQILGDSIEAQNVSSVVREWHEISLCCDQPWCALQECVSDSNGYFLEFDVGPLGGSDVNLEVIDDQLLCIRTSAREPRRNEDFVLGREFGMYQVVHLPSNALADLLSSHVDHQRLSIWIPCDRSSPTPRETSRRGFYHSRQGGSHDLFFRA